MNTYWMPLHVTHTNVQKFVHTYCGPCLRKMKNCKYIDLRLLKAYETKETDMKCKTLAIWQHFACCWKEDTSK
jgi:hypothetical protein